MEHWEEPESLEDAVTADLSLALVPGEEDEQPSAVGAARATAKIMCGSAILIVGGVAVGYGGLWVREGLADLPDEVAQQVSDRITEVLRPPAAMPR